MTRRLLCTDLDRTVIPNGEQPESAHARELFQRLAKRSELTLVYVTGRHRELIEQAILDYKLPLPDYAISDVGTNIYQVDSNAWHPWSEWQDQLSQDWPLNRVEQLKRRLRGLSELTLQESEKQNRFKVSYYVQANGQADQLIAKAQAYTAQCEVEANLIWSVDQQAGLGLLDVLPARANKLTAIRHLMERLGFTLNDTVFAGDSGNDIDVFRSSIPSIVVANADAEIKQLAQSPGMEPIYVAKGTSNGLNGNYCAGLVEGMCYYWPEVQSWLKDD